MKNFTLDQVAYIVICCALSLLFLPDFLLIPPRYSVLAGIIFFVLGLIRFIGKGRPNHPVITLSVIAAAVLCHMHGQALTLIEKAQSVAGPAKKWYGEFHIEEIINQQDYQTVVIKTDNPQLKIYAHWAVDEPPALGERWRGELKLRTISSRLNFGGFDRQKWYLAKGITAHATVKSAVKISHHPNWRQRQLEAALKQTADLPQRGLLLALAFGERAWLPNATWKIYQQTNTAHLIAISGLHVGLAMSLGFMLIRALQLCFPTRRISFALPLCAGAALALAYAELAGFTIPTFRAITAILVVFAFRFARGYCGPWQYFFRTVALLLLCDPMMVLSASFWLSAGAVFCLILWYRLFPLSTWLKPQSTAYKVRYVLGLFHLQLGLLLLFTPIQWMLFGGFSVHGFAANLIAVPAFSLLLVPLVLFAVFARGAFSAWDYADYLAGKITDSLDYFQHGWMPVSDRITLIYTALLALGGLIAIYRKSGAWRNGYWPGALGLLLFSIASLSIERLTRPHWQVVMLDVGQGLAMLIVKNNHAVLYDTGAGWAGGSMAELEIIPYLRRQGLLLDQLILSHDDNDHAGGAKALLQAYPAVPLLSPSAQNYGETDRTFCTAGLSWQWQELNFQVLSPQRPVQEAKNPDSCVISLDDGKHRVLLTGDADVATENKMAAALERIDVLQVGHHGSKTSGGERLIAKTRPKIALISAGRWNPWGFPHPSVVERLRRYQSAVYNSALYGQVNVNFYPDSVKIDTARAKTSPWYSAYFTQ